MLSLITLLPWAPLLTVMASDGADARTEGSPAQPWRQGPVSLASLLSPVIGRVPQDRCLPESHTPSPYRGCGSVSDHDSQTPGTSAHQRDVSLPCQPEATRAPEEVLVTQRVEPGAQNHYVEESSSSARNSLMEQQIHLLCVQPLIISSSFSITKSTGLVKTPGGSKFEIAEGFAHACIGPGTPGQGNRVFLS